MDKYKSRKVAPASRVVSDDVLSQPITLTIERLADDGRGIGVYQGRTLFVRGVLIGETVTVRLLKQTAKYSEARIVEIVEPAIERIQPLCQYFGRCGGCSLQHMSAEQQVAIKQRAVLSQLSRWAGLEPQTLWPALSDTNNDYGYRQRVRIAANYSKTGEVFLGFREADSHRIVNISDCAVLRVELRQTFGALRQWLESIKANNVSHIELIHTAEKVGVVVRHTRHLSVEDRRLLETLLSSEAAGNQPVNTPYHIWFQGEKAGVLSDCDRRIVDPRLSYALHIQGQSAIELLFHPQDFIQSNHAINQLMVAQAVNWLSPQSHEIVLDLFCGVGNFSLPLAQQAAHVIGVEGLSEMVQRGCDNARHNSIQNVSFIAKDLIRDVLRIDSLYLSPEATVPRVDALLLDPPRDGAKTICENIKELSPERIVYVSCNSATFSRDAALLAQNGYVVSHFGVMDMFPNTSHIEVMARFDRVSVSAKPQKQKQRQSNSKQTKKLTLKF